MEGKTVTGVLGSTFVVAEQGGIQLAQYTSRPPGTSPSCAVILGIEESVLRRYAHTGATWLR